MQLHKENSRGKRCLLCQADLWEGQFEAEATTTTQFTYYLNSVATSTTDPTFKTLSGSPTYTASGTFSVIIRRGNDTHKRKQILETWNNC